MTRLTVSTAAAIAALLSLGACADSSPAVPPAAVTKSAVAAPKSSYSHPPLQKTPTGTSVAREVYYFTDLSTMVATSDLVVRAKVIDVKQGAQEFDPGDPSGRPVLIGRRLVLSIEQVLFDKEDAKPVEIEVSEGFWNADGKGIERQGVHWSKSGKKGFFFLKKVEGAEHYSMVSSQGRVLEEDGVLETTENIDVKLRDEIKKLTPAALRKAIGQAGADYKKGKAKPQEVPTG